MTYIQLVDYINLLENYSIETATVPFSGKMRTEFSGKDAFLSQTMSVDEFQSFIENNSYNSEFLFSDKVLKLVSNELFPRGSFMIALPRNSF